MSKSKETKKTGRPPQYDYWRSKDGLTLLMGWARDGLTYEQIAHNMGVSRKTLNEWKVKFSDIGNALKKSREIVDYYVENALLQSALSGNTTAQIFWLKNRCSKHWKDKPEDESQDDMNKITIVNDLPKEEEVSEDESDSIDF